MTAIFKQFYNYIILEIYIYIHTQKHKHITETNYSEKFEKVLNTIVAKQVYNLKYKIINLAPLLRVLCVAIIIRWEDNKRRHRSLNVFSDSAQLW